MNRALKVSGWIVAAIFLMMQLLPRDRNDQVGPSNEGIAQVYPVPIQVRNILQNSCYDCHSDHTIYPWYAQVQPIRYFLDQHVREGKAGLNFDRYSSYSPRKKRSRLRAIGESLEEGSMPLYSYTLMHPKALISKEERAAILAWVKKNSDGDLLKNIK